MWRREFHPSHVIIFNLRHPRSCVSSNNNLHYAKGNVCFSAPGAAEEHESLVRIVSNCVTRALKRKIKVVRVTEYRPLASENRFIKQYSCIISATVDPALDAAGYRFFIN